VKFFDAQRREARNRWLWRCGYVLAILATQVSVATLAVLLAQLFSRDSSVLTSVFVFTLLGLAVVIGLSLWRHPLARLSGAQMALELGGEPLRGSNLERTQLLNVSAEMAVSARIPAPAIYVLEAVSSVNGLAIGPTAADSVVLISAGSFVHLQRDELQALVAWCIGRIRAGESAIDTSLLGLQHALLAPFALCVRAFRWIRRTAGSIPLGYTRRGTSVDASAFGMLIGLPALLGAGVSGLGYVFATVLQAAAMRRGMFKADAAVIELTRSRDPLLSLLLKLPDDYALSRMGIELSEELTHLCFAPSGWTARMFLESHPSAARRIARFDAGVDLDALRKAPKRRVHEAPVAWADPEAQRLGLVVTPQHPGWQALVGTLATAEDSPAAALPDPQQQPGAAYALLLALFETPLNEDGLRQRLQANRDLLKNAAHDTATPDSRQFDAAEIDAKQLVVAVQPLSPRQRIELVESCAAALALQPAELGGRLLRVLQRQVFADGRIELLEWAQWSCLEAALKPAQKATRRPGQHSLQQRAADIRQLLLWMVRRSGASDATALQLLRRHEAALWLDVDDVLPVNELQLFDTVIERLEQLQPTAQRQLLDELQSIAEHDGRCSDEEWLLLRGLSAAWACPLKSAAREDGIGTLELAR
jgi:Zn-dependent protease with chaperone function